MSVFAGEFRAVTGHSAPKSSVSGSAHPLNIDGSVGEGGGQMMRIALPLSGALGVPVRIHSIRAGRSVPGLSTQHLTVARSLADICGASLHGEALRSTDITFLPQSLEIPEMPADVKVQYDIPTDTAASMTLIVQAVLPLIVLRRAQGPYHEVSISGGTHVAFSPPLDFLRYVFLPLLRAMNVKARLASFTKGFYPVGRGNLKLIIEPQMTPILPIRLVERGRIVAVRAVVWATGLDSNGALTTRTLIDELNVNIRTTLGPYLPPDVPITVWEDPQSVNCAETEFTIASATRREFKGSGWGHRGGRGRGRRNRAQQQYNMMGCQLWCETDTGCIINANGGMETGGSNKSNMVTYIDPAEIARSVTSRVSRQLSAAAAVDEHTADQLLIFMAAAAVSAGNCGTNGMSSILCEPYDEEYSSRHIETAIFVIEEIYNAMCIAGKGDVSCKFSIKGVDNGCRLIECSPVGYRNGLH